MSSQTTTESISGLVERVTFFNEETGFAVLKVQVKGKRDLVVVVCNLPSANAGEWITAEGGWSRTRDHGLQFQATMAKCSAPTTLEGIEKYLGGGMVKGIGPVYARKLVERFGAGIFEIIENFSARLEEVEGIGGARRKVIKAAWAEQKVVREIMVFLHSNGVSTSRAVRIYKTYGEQAIEKVRENPYRLAQDIPGIGFKSADLIAAKLGVPPESLLRAEAGLRHVLREAGDQGHCGLPVEPMRAGAVALLGVGEGVVQQGLDRMVEVGELVLEPLAEEPLAMLPEMRRAEATIADKLRALATGALEGDTLEVEAEIAKVEAGLGSPLAPSQREALGLALTRKALVITGGPGVGKTTLVNAILKVLRSKGLATRLCAPTGRAAKRLQETTGVEARTIHRLLEFQPGRGFQRNARQPLEADLLVMDETSMVDVPLMAAFLRAAPETARLVLVGDVDQLPPVGPGNTLRDIIRSGVVPVVHLTEIFRQAAGSRIILASHAINQGRLPDLENTGPNEDFYFIERDSPEAILQTLRTVVRERIPKRFGLEPKKDVQVLCPMNRGSLGVRAVNETLQNDLNPVREGDPVCEKFGWQFRVGDKVIQTENDYDKEVFNGDIGRVEEVRPEDREVVIAYDGRPVTYDYGEMDRVALAYATTVHKAQGSEFPAVVIPLAMQHYVLLQRNLLYTGITRGRKLVVVIGERRALEAAVRNNPTRQRHGALLQRLISGGESAPAD